MWCPTKRAAALTTEASLPAELARRSIRAVGALTYMSVSSKGGATAGAENLIIPDIVYVYDMEVSEDFICKPHDHGVKEFMLMTIDEIKTALLCQEFMTTSAVVMIDFLVRHGKITAENEGNYVELVGRMHRRLPFITTGE